MLFSVDNHACLFVLRTHLNMKCVQAHESKLCNSPPTHACTCAHTHTHTHTHIQRSSNSYSAGLPTCAKTTDGKEVGGTGSNRKWVGQVATGSGWGR